MPKSQRVTVGAEPTKLNVFSDLDGVWGLSISVKPVDGTIDIGGEDVATGDGYPVNAGVQFGMDLVPGEDVYGVAAAGTVEVAVFQIGV